MKQYFNVEKLKMARIRILQEAVLLPHKDLVELEQNKKYYRVLVSLNDSPYSYHSDESSVFRMRVGEV